MAIAIFKPIMAGDTGIRKVGLAVYKVLREGGSVKLINAYRRKDGSYLYPHPFYMLKSNMAGYPQETRKGTRLVIIPLHHFKEGVDEWITEEDIAKAQH